MIRPSDPKPWNPAPPRGSGKWALSECSRRQVRIMEALRAAAAPLTARQISGKLDCSPDDLTYPLRDLVERDVCVRELCKGTPRRYRYRLVMKAVA